jgi:inner membrane protein
MTAGYIKIPVFSKSDVKNFKAEITIDGKNMIAVSEFNKLDAGSYGNKNSFYSIKIPNEFQGKDATLHYSWDSQGSRSINLGQGVYTLNLDSEFDNIRIKGSDYGSLEENSKNTKAVFNIDSSYETDQPSSFRATDIKYAGIDFLSGADDITMVDRITKYASLVIVLTFFMIFLLDMRRRFIANKIQYILVGVSLCLFYLLNLSLGEEIGFMGAYIIATIVTMVINGAYIGTALNSKKYGIATATGLLVIYAVIYWLIQVQSINLLAGTVLLYIVLMIMMFYTAKMNQNKTNNI